MAQSHRRFSLHPRLRARSMLKARRGAFINIHLRWSAWTGNAGRRTTAAAKGCVVGFTRRHGRRNSPGRGHHR